MTSMNGRQLLDAVVDAWNRNNLALLNLLRALPSDGLNARAMTGSPSVAEMFTHMHHERMVSVQENVPESSVVVPAQEWVHEQDAERIAAMLLDSAVRVREAVVARVLADRPLDEEFAHPIQLLQFLIFHEGYHHGQIKLALKAAGCPLDDREIGRGTWGVWMRKSERPHGAA